MRREIVKKIVILFLISILIEIFIFNMRCFQSMVYKETILCDSHMLKIEGGHVLANGDLKLDDGSDHLELLVRNINMPLKNIRLDIEIVDESVSMWQEDNVCDVEIFVCDEALHEQMGDDGITFLESGLYRTTHKSVLKSIESSQYIWLETYDDVKEIRLEIKSASGQGKTFRLNNIVFNARQDMRISMFRLVTIFFIVTLVYMSLFEKRLWNSDCISPAGWKVWLPILLFTVVAVVSFLWSMSNLQLRNTLPNEYAQLARSLLHGKTYVGKGGNLAEAYSENIVFWNPSSNEIRFDYAYYNGKYYVYFGVLPCIVFFIPYLLLTGKDLPNYIPVIILCMTILAEIYVFFGVIIKRYYRDTSYAMRMLMTLAVSCGMYLPLFISASDQYMIPIFMSTALTIGGIILCIKGIDTVNDGCIRFRYGYILIGSLCMALVSLCRPTILVYGFSFWGIFIFYNRSNLKSMNTKDMIKGGLSIAIPYFVIAAFCMGYNYIRFDSPFDFGVSKNMTTIPFNGGIGYLPYIIFRTLYEYMFESSEYSDSFPFVVYQNAKRIMEGGSLLYVTKPGIGLFISSPMLWLGGLCIFFHRSLKKKRLFLYLITLLVCAFFVMIFDSVFTCYITDRYTMDFSFVFFLWSFLAIMELGVNVRSHGSGRIGEVIRKSVVIFLLVTIFVGGLMILPEAGCRHLLYGNTELYYRLYYAVNFML